MAQAYEGEYFPVLLRSLCNTVEQPAWVFGRPRLPLPDMLFSIALKVYSTMSTRRAMSDFRDARAKGLLDTVPSFTSVFRYMEDAGLAPVLKGLIERSALPLRAVETDFAADSSGFSTSVYNRWFDHKWGKERKEVQWVKAHIFTGVQTNIVTTADATPGHSNDAPYLPSFVVATARNFNVEEVSVDKAYLSKRNLRAVVAVGAVPYIPFKTNSVGHQGDHRYDGLWDYMWHYFTFNNDDRWSWPVPGCF